jgi:sporulation protein YlmC with PRC-barrel domain
MAKKELSASEINNDVTLEDVLGKDVIDSQGEFLGVVESIYIDPETIEISGISVDNGLLKKGLLIGKTYIRNVAPHAVFLKIQPLFNLKGMLVFDMDGKKIGKIEEVQLKENKNELQNLIVRSSNGKLAIPGDCIEHVGDNVFINKKIENFLKA